MSSHVSRQRFSLVWEGTMGRYDMVWYHMIWYHIIWYDMISYDIMSYDTAWYDMAWYDMVWYDVILGFTIRHDTISYDMIRYIIISCDIFYVYQVPGMWFGRGDRLDFTVPCARRHRFVSCNVHVAWYSWYIVLVWDNFYHVICDMLRGLSAWNHPDLTM